MPFYSREVCDRVRGSNDIVDVISSYVKLQKRGNRYFGLCPFHTEKTGSFCVSPDSQMYHCFGCNESGNVVGFLMKIEGMEFTDAIESLAGRCGMEITPEKGHRDSVETRQFREELFAANKAAAEYYYRMLKSPDGAKGLSYFSQRGLSKEIIAGFGLGYTGPGSGGLYKDLKEKGFSQEVLLKAGLIIFDEKQGARDRFFNRVMFPIMDVNRRVIAFGGRVMGQGEPKYLNSPETPIFNKSETLYGLFAARRSKRREIILCEGYMDVISSHMAGFDNAVATLGTALTESHANILKRMKRPVILCYDSDGAGRKAAVRGYEILKAAGISARIMDLSPYKDPDEIIKAEGPEGFENRIAKADNALLVIMKWQYEDIDTNDPDEMSGFIHTLAGNIASIGDEAKRASYIAAAAPRFSIDVGILTRQVNGSSHVGLISPVGEREKIKRRGLNKDDALKTAEGMLLSFLLEADFYNSVKDLLFREDFSEEDFKNVFDRIISGMENGSSPVPADLVEEVNDPTLKNEFAKALFEVGDADSTLKSDFARAKKEALLRVKKASLKRAGANIDPKDTDRLQQDINTKRDLIKEIETREFK